ncbi:MOB kinase activator 1B isoform X1 [Oxyura jamaicensis]|uniref:MOB kinase activator 1B isoform X1 n=1 Tax=Oxyura jamaicensis TaxID=8884 RepID=UPI0015A65051|nr:MOB kinase activator 1B isoform X1 [Oxyura jamaicensis]
MQGAEEGGQPKQMLSPRRLVPDHSQPQQWIQARGSLHRMLGKQFGVEKGYRQAIVLQQFSQFFHSTCGSRSSKTFKPKKNIPEGSHQYELLKHAEATLGSGNLRMAVMLPEGEDLNEWVAVNTVDFFNQINMLYGTITDFCTEESCPVMSAGPKYEYHWADGTNIKKPIKCSAPKYIDYLMTWVQDQLDDETLFPSKIGVPFPKNFMSVAKTILKRLFRVYAHIYHQHFDPVIQLQEEAHLNTSFKHFIFFVQEFNLIDRRELAPLQELIEKLTSKDR